MSQENVEIVRRHIEAYAAGDAERALSFVDPAIEVDLSRGDPVEQDRYQGREGLARYVRTFRGAFTDYRFEIRQLRGAGDEVVALIHEAGRGKASGVEAERLDALVYTLRTRRIVCITQYPDYADALEAAGLRD
jgi:ketosteroid isomerase-like protein